MKLNRPYRISGMLLLIAALSLCLPARGQSTLRQGPPVPASFSISPGDMELFKMINQYRKENGLAPVQLSRSLSYVAALHVKDLFLHHPDAGNCNTHSWSSKGFWAPFCYPKDETKKNSVWDKPKELTRYPSKAYEIVYWENNPVNRDTVMFVWQTEEYFNNFLLNTGKWNGTTWNAIGVAVYENYACAWFGEVADPDVPVTEHKAEPVVKKENTAVKEVRNAPAPVAPATITSNDSLKRYYIIIKTNIKQEAAEKLVSNLKSQGYPDATVLLTDGKVRISVFQSADKTKVMTTLKEVKKTYKDAWLLKAL